MSTSNPIEAAEDVDTREVTEWAYRSLDLRVCHPSGDGGHLTAVSRDFRQVLGVYGLQVGGDDAGWFELHTSDGSVFEVTVTRKS